MILKLADISQKINIYSEVSWIKKYLSRGDRWLDISSGNGQIIKEIIRFNKKNNFKISFSATEFTNFLLNYLIEEIPECTLKKSIDDFENQSFNFISLLFVIDHVEDPNLVISKLS